MSVETKTPARLPWYRSPVVSALALFLAFALSAAYAYSFMNVGWLPQDDGTLAQGALRVLNGELPHRDFAENYTGGLSLLHALAFRLGGVSLVSLRYCVFLFFLLWVAAVLYIATQFTSAIPAAGIAMLAAVWSLPQYPASMPSWYNLFFAGFGAAALLRYLNVRTKRWLFLAGVFGGLSFLIKITGLYYIAAIMLFLLFREQQLSAIAPGEPSHPSTLYSSAHSAAYSTALLAGLLAFLASVALLIRHRFDDRHFVHFLLPACALVVLLVARERSIRSGGSARRFTTLFRMLLPFLAGVALPILCFLMPYALSHSLGTFVENVFGLIPNRIATLVMMPPTPPYFILGAAIPILLLVVAACWKRAASAAVVLCVLAVLLAVLLDPAVATWRYIWASARLLTPLVVCVGCAVLLFRPSVADALTPLREQQLLLLLALAAMCSLVQFPFPAPIYFCYSAPLTALAIFALIASCRQPASPVILGAVLVFFLLFGAIRVQPDRIYAHWFFGPQPPVHALNLPRAGGLKVESAQTYENLTHLVQQHAGNGEMIATPECPEVYFLSGVKNATASDGGLQSDELWRAIQLDSVRLVVLNLDSTFSASTITPKVREKLATLFPNTQTVGNYEVHWR